MKIADQTALELAEESSQYLVKFFLLRDPKDQPASPYALQPSITVFVLGNSGSGKSTLIKALSEENSILGRFKKVKGVLPLTPGIEPIVFHSQVFGRVTIYDFAGHEEYYASHEMILCQNSHPIVLLTVKMHIPMHEIEQQLLYWLFILSNSLAVNNYKSMNVMIIGSHADQVKTEEKGQICQNVESLMESESTLNYRGFITLDCRYSTSSQLNQLRKELSILCREIRESNVFHESDYSNRLCASLMHYIRHNIDTSEQVTVSINKLCKQIKQTKWLQTKFPGPSLVQLTNPNLLLDTCITLSSNGHLLLLLDQSTEKSLLVLNEKVVLSHVHACLSVIKEKMANDLGLVEENQLHMILQKLLSKFMKPELAVKYLIITQFCTRITADQLMGGLNQKVYYFFPNLVLASRPADLLSTRDCRYSLLYTWCLKCAEVGQFFTPRFLHTLFIQLIMCENDNTKYIMWKNGIFLVHSNGTRFIIEITDQTRRLMLVIQCMKGHGSQLVEQRSILISLIKSLMRKVCPKVKLAEVLLHCQSSYPPEITSDFEISITELAKPIICDHKFVVCMKNDIPQHVDISELLLFDSFHRIDESIITEIFANKNSDETVTHGTLNIVCEAVSAIDPLVKSIRDREEQALLTYSHLYAELHKYTIFPDGNLCVSFITSDTHS